jgi:hypothetical protein
MIKKFKIYKILLIVVSLLIMLYSSQHYNAYVIDSIVQDYLLNDCEVISKYEEDLFQKNIKIDEVRLRPKYKKCENQIEIIDVNYLIANESNIKILKRQKVFKVKIKNYTCLKLNTNIVLNSIGINIDNINCFAQRFDKSFNTTEKLAIFNTSKPRKFRRKYNYTLCLDNTGFYHVKCSNNFNKTFFENVYVTYPSENKHKLDSKKMNVLLLGIDSVSNRHFERVFPLTLSYLRNNQFIIYKRYHSTGANTYPNLLALLSGIIANDCPELNLKKDINDYFDSKFYDSIPFIFNEFKDKLDYATMYQEDMPPWGTFNYGKHGFRFKPTDYYLRPFWLKYYKIKNGLLTCHNGKPMYETFFDVIENFIKNIRRPYFSLSFLTEYTHNYLWIPPELDTFIMNTVEKWNKEGLFENTLVVLFSDHGNRMKSFLYETDLGQKEMYHPFLAIKLPKSLKETKMTENLIKNRDKLTSSFDLYQTLRHFLEINLNQAQKNSNMTKRQLRGTSLFEFISQNRSCYDALVPIQQCGCKSEREISYKNFYAKTKVSINLIIQLVLENVNNITLNYRHQCEEFIMDKMKPIREFFYNNQFLYKFTFFFQPGNALFEAIFNITSTSNIKIIDAVKRKSVYGDQSICIDLHELKNYCYCKKKM